MAITDAFVLPADLEIIPGKDLDAEVRRQASCGEDDFAVTRPRARTPSRIVDKDGADLLETFQSPRTIVEAILAYSRTRALDPQKTLDEAFPLLQELINSRFLVPADSEEAQTIDSSFSPGQEVAGCRVLRLVQVVEDVEVYQVRHPVHGWAALKIRRAGSKGGMGRLIEREAVVLSRLDGRVNPRLFESGAFEDRAYLLMEWCSGIESLDAVMDLHQSGGGQEREKVLALGGNILDAYAHLHTQGLIHGDVHPRNILIGAGGSVKIIDYGLAAWDRGNSQPRSGLRGGVAFFFEPEYARLARQEKQPPGLSVLGEQYALASLLYLLFTGGYYLDFSLEQDEMLRQIAEDEPLSFESHGLQPWAEVEAVLRQALCKEPEGRFASTAEFAARLKAAAVPPAEKLAVPMVRQPQSSNLLQEMLAHVRPEGEIFATGLQTAPTCSVKIGAGGIGYALHRMAAIRDDPRLLSQADLWITRTLHASSRADAFRNPELEVTTETVGTISPYHNLSGLFAVQALVSQAMGDFATQQFSVQAFIQASSDECLNPDLTLGRSGTLLIGSLLLDAMHGNPMLDQGSLKEMGARTLQTIIDDLEAQPPISAGSKFDYLGIAHGWAGYLYAILRWCRSAGANIPEIVETRLAQLAELAEPYGRGARWQWVLRGEEGPSNYMPGWCNGSAGHVFLWTQAYESLGGEERLRLAEQAAWNAWEEPGATGNICCGFAGRAYSLINMYRFSGDPAWLRRSQALAERASQAVLNDDYPPESLYKGKLGVAMLAADLERPETAALPFFEQERT